MRKIQEAPCVGNIDPKLIQAAVDSVKKPNIIKDLEWICGRLEKIENWISNYERHAKIFSEELHSQDKPHICTVSGAECK